MTGYSSFLDDRGFVIFLFHGVIRRQCYSIRNYTGKHIELEHFEAFLHDLLAHGVPVSMPQIVAAHNGEGALPSRAFAVTFDDGFENNTTIAAPALRRLGIPATFYVTTDFIDNNAMSWIDRIECAVEKLETIRVDSKEHGLKGDYETRDQKLDLLDRIRRILKGNSAIDPYEFADDFCQQLGVGQIVPDPELDHKMTWDQICTLNRDELFNIGGHGHTHRILSYLDPHELEYEIDSSLEKLRAYLGTPIWHYSYPEGLVHCYSDQVIAVLRGHGIVCCPTAEPGVNLPGRDLFRLKRITVVSR
jgi:peptidoglycan/xylan/chitin deacetylase (PgdA/CDA1 family)